MKPRDFLPRVCVAITIGGLASAQDAPSPRPPVEKPAKGVVDRAKQDATRIAVKFHDDLPVRLRGDRLTAVPPAARTLGPAAGLLRRLAAGGATWERMHRVAEDKLADLRDRAQRNSGKVMPDPNSEFILHVPPGMAAETIIDELNALELVELAEPMPLPAPPPVADDYEPIQGHLGPATGGTDAFHAWTQLAGAGGNVWIADIEYAWNLSHTDLGATLIGPAPDAAVVTQSYLDHGTAVIGVMGAFRDGIGTTGAVYNSTLFVVTHRPESGYNLPAAITTATASLRVGDLIVLEAQADGPAPGSADYVPIEWESQATYNAVVNATNAGYIVVEAAGNGSQDLDDPIFNTGHSPFTPAHDSGAIIVGAGGVLLGSGERGRMDFSSFGSRVNLQGWGENVFTTGYGDLYSADGNNSTYTATFGGTSSAAPVVASAVAALQAHYRITNSDAVLGARELREILRATGTRQANGVTSPGGSYSQSGTTVTRQTGLRDFSSSDINSIVRFSGGEEGLIIAVLSNTQVTVSTSQTVAATTLVLRRPATQNIGPLPNLRLAMQYVSGARVWVDFAYAGTEDGSFFQPFNTMPEGIAAVPLDGRVIVKGGSNPFTGPVTKALTLQTFGASTTLGQ